MKGLNQTAHNNAVSASARFACCGVHGALLNYLAAVRGSAGSPTGNGGAAPETSERYEKVGTPGACLNARNCASAMCDRSVRVRMSVR